MSCKIKIDPHNKKAGKLCYLLMTSDAASLEARVATSDTALNDTGIDPVLYSIYDPASGLGEDLHSATSYNTFGKSINLQINEIVDDATGKTWLCLDNQQLKVSRNGTEIKVYGKDLKETDTVLEYV